MDITYKTILTPSEIEIVEKKSRFIGFACPVSTEEEANEFLRISNNYFENKGYKVYFTGYKYEYNDAKRTVQSNELMVAIRDRKG